MMVFFSFISGLTFGAELFLGEQLDPEDKFAMAIHLGIVRITLIVPK